MLNNRRTGRSTFSIAGWLFADLLLALMMIFLIASAVGAYTPPQKKPSKTPTPLPRISALSQNSVNVTITVDPNGLLNNDSGVAAQVEDQVRSQLKKYGSSKAGIVLTFGGGPDAGQDTSIAMSVNDILRSMGARHFVFDHAVFRNFIDLSGSLGTIDLEVYFFVYTK